MIPYQISCVYWFGNIGNREYWFSKVISVATPPVMIMLSFYYERVTPCPFLHYIRSALNPMDKETVKFEHGFCLLKKFVKSQLLGYYVDSYIYLSMSHYQYDWKQRHNGSIDVIKGLSVLLLNSKITLALHRCSTRGLQGLEPLHFYFRGGHFSRSKYSNRTVS